jgi:hypothetical protein
MSNLHFDISLKLPQGEVHDWLFRGGAKRSQGRCATPHTSPQNPALIQRLLHSAEHCMVYGVKVFSIYFPGKEFAELWEQGYGIIRYVVNTYISCCYCHPILVVVIGGHSLTVLVRIGYNTIMRRVATALDIFRTRKICWATKTVESEFWRIENRLK